MENMPVRCAYIAVTLLEQSCWGFHAPKQLFMRPCFVFFILSIISPSVQWQRALWSDKQLNNALESVCRSCRDHLQKSSLIVASSTDACESTVGHVHHTTRQGRIWFQIWQGSSASPAQMFVVRRSCHAEKGRIGGDDRSYSFNLRQGKRKLAAR
jgi:hypothetical protein